MSDPATIEAQPAKPVYFSPMPSGHFTLIKGGDAGLAEPFIAIWKRFTRRG